MTAAPLAAPAGSPLADPAPERTREIAHVGAVELLSADPEATVAFFVDLMGLTEVGRAGASVYLHTWDDYEAVSVIVTESAAAGVGRTYLRSASEQALHRRVAAIEAAGLAGRWSDDEYGIGPCYLFDDPDSHAMGLYWQTERYSPTAELRPALKNQAARFPGRGANVRRLDHVNYLTADVPGTIAFLDTVLNARQTEQIRLDSGKVSGSWFSVSDKSYDLVYTEDWAGAHGRLHHLAFATDTREDILRAADVFLDAGIHIETGPHKHAIQQTFFLYVYEPAGNRIELCNAGARLLLAPDWETVVWTEAERAKGQAWGLKTIPSFHTHGTPPLD